MPREKQVSAGKRASVVILHGKGYSRRIIVQKIKIAKSTVDDGISVQAPTKTVNIRTHLYKRQNLKIDISH